MAEKKPRDADEGLPPVTTEMAVELGYPLAGTKPEELATAKPLHPKAEKPKVIEKGPHRTVPIWPI